MKNSVALITGATSGIGRETALFLAKQGMKIAAVGRNEQAGKILIEEIQALGSEALFIKTDICDAKSVGDMVLSATNHFGKIDVAVNSAGISGTFGPLAKMEEKDWDFVINTNLKGLWLCMKHEIASMIQSGGGCIVNIGAHVTQMTKPNTAIYTASKAGVEALGRIAAVENGKYGIRINTISPGPVDTPMLRRVYSEEMLTQVKKSNPLGKIGSAKDIAEAVFWLSSPQSNHVNGASLTIDGGV